MNINLLKLNNNNNNGLLGLEEGKGRESTLGAYKNKVRGAS